MSETEITREELTSPNETTSHLEEHKHTIAIVSVVIATFLAGIFFYNYAVQNWFAEPVEMVVVTPSTIETEITVDNALSLAHKGSLEFKEKEYGEQAVQIFEKVLNSEPSNIEALLGIGYAYEIMEEYTKSLEYYNQALALDPNSAIIYNRIGHMYDLSEGMEKAEPLYRKALEIDPSYVDARINMARVYLRQGKSEDAMSILKEVYTSKSLNNRTRAELAYLLFANAFDNAEYAEAKAYIEEAKNSDPTLPMVWVGMGLSRLYEVQDLSSSEGTMQLYEESLGHFDKAAKLYEYQTAAYYWKGRTVLLAGDYASAVSLFTTAKEVVKKDITLMQEQRIAFEEEIEMYLLEAEKKKSKEVSYLMDILNSLLVKKALAYSSQACCNWWGNCGPNGAYQNCHTCQQYCQSQEAENNLYLSLVGGTGAHSASVTGNTVVCINGAFATYVPLGGGGGGGGGGGSSTSTSAPAAPTYSCTGAEPDNIDKIKCPNTEANLTANRPWTDIGTTELNCVTGGQCEYYVPAPLSVSILAPSEAQVGDPVTWRAMPDGGVPPYQYSWSGSWTGGVLGTEVTYTKRFADTDSMEATVTVTDSVGHSTPASKSVNIINTRTSQ